MPGANGTPMAGNTSPTYNNDGYLAERAQHEAYTRAQQQYRAQQQAPDRIDPKQVPRRQVEKGNDVVHLYFTRSGHNPPASTSEFKVVDDGNCSPRFVRLTCNSIAQNPDMVDATKLCVGAIIQPLSNLQSDEEPIPLIQPPAEGTIRCSACRAYVNPFFKFIDAGTKFQCNLCGTVNPLPDFYQCNLDADGLRRDRLQRPELCRGTVEYVAGPEFLLRPVQDPCFIFLIDVSKAALDIGLVETAVQAVREALTGLAADQRCRAGIVTFDSTVHFYALRPPRAEPQIVAMTDIEDVFLPLPPEEILVRVSDPACMSLLEAVLDLIPRIFVSNPASAAPNGVIGGVLPMSPKAMVDDASDQCAVGAALQVAGKALVGTGGKLLLIQGSMCNAGVGALTIRDDSKLYNTDKEKTLFIAQTPFYQQLATDCAENAITVDMYICANSYVDLATTGVMSTKTGGQIYTYPGFSARKDGEALMNDVRHNCTRTTGYDAVMIVRCSTGLKVADMFGNFYHKRKLEMDLPSIDCDKAFGVRFEHEGKMMEKMEACFQVALLYTTNLGERRVRIHTISVPVTNNLSSIFRGADLDAIINLSLKQAVRQLGEGTSSLEAQQALTQACVDSLYVYRKHCASSTSSGQLILPEPLKLLPLFTLGINKNPLLQAGVRPDERSFLFALVNRMPTHLAVPFVVPRLFDLANIPRECCVVNTGAEGQPGRVFLPSGLSLSRDKMRTDGLYLLDDGRFLYLYVGENISDELLWAAFGIDRSQPPPYSYVLAPPQPDNPDALSTRIHALLKVLRSTRPHFSSIQTIVRAPQYTGRAMGLPSDASLDEANFNDRLLEDTSRAAQAVMQRTGKKPQEPNLMSYVDFLCWVHKRIQERMDQR